MKNKKTIWEWMEQAVATIKTIMGIIPKNVKKYATNSLEVTTRLKSVLDNPVVDIITAIVPGNSDDAIVKSMRELVGKAIQFLTIVDNCADKEDVNEMLLCWADNVRKLHPTLQGAALHKLASLLTAYQDNEALRQRLYDLYVQMMYVDKKGDTNK